MSSSPLASNLGDAVRPDGTLKDASEIVWNYDADESLPFPSGGDSAPASVSSGTLAPATSVAAVRRTARVSRPSWRVLEAGEAELASIRKTSGVKRKAASDPHDDRATRGKVITVVSDDAGDDSGDGASDGGTPSPPPTEPASDDYEALTAMADADNQVCSTCHSFLILFSFPLQAITFRTREERTADVRVIFRRDKEYVHPDTGKTLVGHWCTVCR